MNKSNRVELTQESILKTRQHFADICQGCIDEVLRGEVRVNDQEAYFKWQREMAADHLNGKYDHTLSSLQYAHFIQTGEMVAILPK